MRRLSMAYHFSITSGCRIFQVALQSKGKLGTDCCPDTLAHSSGDGKCSRQLRRWCYSRRPSPLRNRSCSFWTSRIGAKYCDAHPISHEITNMAGKPDSCYYLTALWLSGFGFANGVNPPKYSEPNMTTFMWPSVPDEAEGLSSVRGG